MCRQFGCLPTESEVWSAKLCQNIVSQGPVRAVCGAVIAMGGGRGCGWDGGLEMGGLEGVAPLW